MNDIFINGFGGDVALAATRVAVGTFFVISGYHKLFNAQRHAAIVATLTEDKAPAVAVTQWVIPIAEFLGGLALIFGFLVVPAAAGLLVILIGALKLDGIKRIAGYHPIDRADWLDDLLYLPETLFAILLVVIAATGAGPYSIDGFVALLF